MTGLFFLSAGPVRPGLAVLFRWPTGLTTSARGPRSSSLAKMAGPLGQAHFTRLTHLWKWCLSRDEIGPTRPDQLIKNWPNYRFRPAVWTYMWRKCLYTRLAVARVSRIGIGWGLGSVLWLGINTAVSHMRNICEMLTGRFSISQQKYKGCKYN